MVRSKWTTVTIIAGLACAGLTFAGLGRGEQASTKAPAGVNPTEIVTISEPGKPAQQCVIQKSTRLADGKIAHEVRNLATGEVTTIYMEDNGQAKGQATMGVGSKSASRPIASSVAPGSLSPNSNMKVVPAPIAESTRPVTQSSAANKLVVQTPANSGASPGLRTIDEPGKPPLQCRIVLQWQTPEGHKASQLQAVDNGEYLTIVEANTAANGSSNTNGDKVSAKLYRWGSSKTPPPGVPVPSTAIVSQPPRPLALDGQTVTKVVPPASKSAGAVQAQKPSASTSYINATTIARTSPATPATTTWTQASSTTAPAVASTKPVATAPVVAKASDVTKATDQSASTLNDVAKGSIAVPKPLEIPTPMVPLKTPDRPIVVEATSTISSTQQLEMPKMPEMPKAPEPVTTTNPEKVESGLKTPGLPLVPEPAKAKAAVPPPPPLLPIAPFAIPTEQKKSETAPDFKLLGVGKPSADSTLPTDGKPSLNSTQPTLTAPPVGTSVAAMPPTLTQLTIGNANTPIAANRKSDPLNSPEALLPGRSEKEMVKSPSIGMAQATDGGRIPLGAGSVSAAGDPRYLPVPMVTIPQANPPMPPMLPGSVPTATPGAPIIDQTPFVNAFTTAAPTNGQQQYPMQQPMMPQGNGMQAYSAQTAYRGPMPPNPVAGMQGYTMPMMPQGYQMMPPQSYQMPMPPQGYQMPVMPQGYPAQMMPMQPAMGYSNPAMDRPGIPVGNGSTMQQSINLLQSSIFPTKREQAVMQLCTCDPSANPGVVQLLLTTAKEDPSGTVRAACVSGLARMGVVSELALATYTQLKSDADPRVRQEAEQALARSTPTNNVQPAGAINRQ